MKVQLLLLWGLLLSGGIALNAVDLDNILDEKKDDAPAAEKVEPEKVEEVKPVEEVVEVIEAPKPVAVPEPKVEAAPKQEKKDRSFLYRLAMWLPNLLVDLDDVVSLNVGVGSKFGVQPRVTRYLQLGGANGSLYFATKGYGRQYGGGYEQGWSFEPICVVKENRYVEDVGGTVEPYLIKQQGFEIPTYRQDVYKENIRDLWEIGAGAGWLVYFEAHVHPVEIADFITGIFFYDLSGDEF